MKGKHLGILSLAGVSVNFRETRLVVLFFQSEPLMRRVECLLCRPSNGKPKREGDGGGSTLLKLTVQLYSRCSFFVVV